MAGPPAQAYLPPQGPGFEVGYASMPGYGPAPQVRHLSTEGHLLALGMWNRVSGFFMLIVGGLLMVMAMVGVLTVSRNAGQAGVFMGAGLFGSAVFLVIGFLVLMLGNALQKFSDTARLVSGALSCLWLVWDVIQLAAVAGSRGAGGATLVALLGIVYTGAVIAVLFSRQAQEVCSVPLSFARGPHASPQGFNV